MQSCERNQTAEGVRKKELINCDRVLEAAEGQKMVLLQLQHVAGFLPCVEQKPTLQISITAIKAQKHCLHATIYRILNSEILITRLFGVVVFNDQQKHFTD
jgi:hypothetical protein